MLKTATKIGPADHGRRMSLADFEFVEVEDGYLYELSRGVIVVSDVPKAPHMLQVNEIRRQISAYDNSNLGRISVIAAGSECKLLTGDFGSERHPDLAIYKSMPPLDDDELWRHWIPEIVIEVVSPSSLERDYLLKPEEYFNIGIQEYWLFNADKEELIVMKRHGDSWRQRVIQPPETYKTRLLPGFVLDCGKVFKAAKRVKA